MTSIFFQMGWFNHHLASDTVGATGETDFWVPLGDGGVGDVFFLTSQCIVGLRGFLVLSPP